MPTYEYVCTDCGIHIDVVQKMSEPTLETCGACGGRLRKVFHPAGILFKGSGFYATDNRSKQKTGVGEGSDDKTSGSDKKPGSDKKTEKTEKTDKKSAETKTSAESGKSQSKTPAKETA